MAVEQSLIENTCPVKNFLIDTCMACLTAEEFKVLIYTDRHTLGVEESRSNALTARISVDEYSNGVKIRKGRRRGERIDRGTGLSASSVRNGLATLKQFGFIRELEPADFARNEAALIQLVIDPAGIDLRGLESRAESRRELSSRKIAKAQQVSRSTRSVEQTGSDNSRSGISAADPAPDLVEQSAYAEEIEETPAALPPEEVPDWSIDFPLSDPRSVEQTGLTPSVEQTGPPQLNRPAPVSSTEGARSVQRLDPPQLNRGGPRSVEQRGYIEETRRETKKQDSKQALADSRSALLPVGSTPDSTSAILAQKNTLSESSIDTTIRDPEPPEDEIPPSTGDPVLDWLIRNASDTIPMPANFIQMLDAGRYRDVKEPPDRALYREWLLSALKELGKPDLEFFEDWKRRLNTALKNCRTTGRYVSPLDNRKPKSGLRAEKPPKSKRVAI